MVRNMETAGFANPEQPRQDLDTSIENLNDIFGNNEESAEVRQAFTEAGFSETSTTAEVVADTASTPETAPAQDNFYSRAAERLTNSTATVAALLEKFGAGAPARQEARAEKMEAAKEKAGKVIRKIGRGALRVTKVTSSVVLELSSLTMDATGVTDAREAVTHLSKKARASYAKRVERREQKRRAVTEQNEAFASYEPNVEATQNREENERMDAEYKAEELAMLEEAHGENDAFDTERKREEEVRAEFAAYKAELLAKRAAAYERRANRKARRQEFLGNVRDKSGELYKKALGGAKRFGRAALTVFKRTATATKAAAKAAVSAGAQAWSESASPSPSN